MNVLYLWLILLSPTKECIDRDQRLNFVEFVDPAVKNAKRVRIRGEDPRPQSFMILTHETKKDPPLTGYDETCYDLLARREDFSLKRWKKAKPPEKKEAK